MKWPEVILGDVCSKIGSGATPKGGSTVYIEDGTSFIRSQNVYNLRFDYDGLVHITEDAAQKLNGVTIEEQDVLINITGDSVARTCVVPSCVLPARVNQHVAIIRPKPDVLNPLFLNYYLASPYMQAFMLGLAVGKGASRNAMTKDMIAGFKIPCPPIRIQEAIVNKASAYDDLIENNKKQIALLEEAAQRLYKEWFVDLRFPGYEDVQIVDGVPEGWRLGVLSEVASLNVTAIDYDYPYSEIEYVDLGSVNKGHILGKKKYLLQDAPGRARRLAKHGDVIWGMVRPNLKAYALVQNESSNTVYSTGFAIITAKSVPFTFMYCATTTEEFVGYLVGCTNGAAYPAVKPSHFQDAKILIPSENVLKAFHQITEPIFCKIGYLDEMNNYLAEVRDRLLPKLMSGEIEL